MQRDLDITYESVDQMKQGIRENIARFEKKIAELEFQLSHAQLKLLREQLIAIGLDNVRPHS